MSSTLAAGIRHLRGKLAVQERREDSDEQLLHAFLSQHDDSAFAVLVRRHSPMVLHVCRCLLKHQQDAEDAFQATFLVLARNAAALRKKASLASFLHGIAYRTAMKAKRIAARRRKREGQTLTRPAVDPADELSWREVRALLNEEIARLPEIYRSVFVLCHLEDLSRAEAAQRLGLKERTVLSRLAEARKRLSQRLARRGVELTAVLAASAVATQPASASLMAATVQAATAMGAGARMAGLVSASVLELAKAVTTAAMLHKTKMAAALLLIMGLLSGAGLWWSAGFKSPSGGRQPPETSETQGTDAPRSGKKGEAKTLELHGRVLAPDGQPKAGAKLLLLAYEDQKVTELGISAEDGRFTVAVPKEVGDHSLIAWANGTGIDFLNLRDRKPGKPVELRLVKDQVIRGRVVNTEGKPLAGVRVAINSINIYAKSSLDSFLAAWRERDSFSQIPWGEKAFWSKAGTLLPTMTDSEGRFALHGAGAERLVSLRLHGAGMAATEVWVINRAGFDPRSYNQATQKNIPKEIEVAHRWVLHGPVLSIVADAEKPIRGTVKDTDSGKGLPNVVIQLDSTDENQHWGVRLQARTDAAGHYELHGVRKAKKYLLEVEADTRAGYTPSQVQADDTPGYEPISVEIPVKKGVIITGKVIDQATGKTVPGFAEAVVLHKNPFAKAYPEFATSPLVNFGHTGENDSFRIVTVPGPVLLMGGVAYGRMPGGYIERMKYKPVAPDPKYPQYFTKVPGFPAGFLDFMGRRAIVQGDFCKVLDIKPGTDVVEQDILLERASALPMKIQDAEGRPLPGVWVKGIGSQRADPAVRIENDSCSVYHLEAAKPRLIVFYHPERKLAASLTLKGDEKPPITVKLGAAGSIKGRLLDAEGKPLAEIVVEVRYRDCEADDVHEATHKLKQVVTDATGAFLFEGLIPGRQLYLYALRRGKRLVEEGSNPPHHPTVHEVQPGECRDLGALKLKPPGG